MRSMTKALALALPGLAATASAQDGGRLEEITVTARRVEESLQEVPSAITALSADFINEQRIRDVAQVLEFTPGANFTSWTKGQQDYSLRGITSQNEGAAGDSSVATYVDNVVIGKDFAKSVEFFDIDRVEVLRGPQGTTFGRNTSAGLIHILTKRPTRDFESYVEATAGNYGLYDLTGVLNGALTESLSARLSAHYDDREGYTTDVSTGDDLDWEQNTTVRGQVLFEPSSSFNALLKLEWTKDDDGGAVRKGADCTRPMLEQPFGDYTEPCDPWKSDLADNRDFFLEREVFNTTAELQWDLSDAVRLTSVTAYIDATLDRVLSAFGTPFEVLIQSGKDDAWQFSQELRLDNSAADAALNWLVGLYWYTDDHQRNGDNREVVVYIPELATYSMLTNHNETTSYGVFGQLGYDFTERLSLTVGGRYTSDKKDFSVSHRTTGPIGDAFVDPGSNPFSANVSNTWDQITGSVSLGFRATDQANFYASVSRGYKSGGFNGEPSDVASAIAPYDEEIALNYEIGAKTDWLDNRLRLNAAVFYMDYSDLQVQDFLPSGVAFIDNAGGVTVPGIELESVFVVNDYLTLLASYAYLDGELEGTVGGISVDGNIPDTMPKWTASLAANLNIPLSNGSQLIVRGDYRGRSDVYEGPFEEDLKPAVDVFGARIAWISPLEMWDIALWGRNLTDEAEVVGHGPATIVSQAPTAYGPPRTYGLTVRYNF